MTGPDTLADLLTRDGHLLDPSWRAAFASVPRETFVPYFLAPGTDRPGWRIVADDDEYRTGLYSDRVLVTQLGGSYGAVEAIRRGERVYDTPTSSSSAPSLMATMLDALAIGDDMRVLEIGTGTGYNAALLSHRLGDKNVTSVEVDGSLATRARSALATAGYEPTVVIGDGALGYRPNAPYDRVLATVAVPSVPPAWINQTADDAMLLVPLAFAGHGGLMALVRRTETGAVGGFLGQYGGFMPVRARPPQPNPTIDTDLLDSLRPTDVPVEVIRDGHPSSFFVSLACPIAFSAVGFMPSTGGPEQTWCRGADGSQFVLVVEDEQTRVATDGPLWMMIEEAYGLWHELDQPRREYFRITVEPGRQWVWLDDPDGECWPIPL